MHWRLIDSPVTVAGNIQIRRGGTVTVDAGVEVLMASGSLITVEDILDIRGLPGLPVIFSGQGGANWRGLYFTGLSAPYVPEQVRPTPTRPSTHANERCPPKL